MMTSTSSSIRELQLSDLRPADVLLSRGEGVVSDLIAKNDGGKYSHGALWSGKGIVQATSAGITHTPLSGSHDVYRRHGLTEDGARQIVTLALAELEGRYAYGELVLLAVLFMSGIRVRGAWGSRALEAIGGRTASNLKKWLDEHAGKKVRVCTELVASCFFRTADQKFALEILPAAERPAPETALSATTGLPPLGSDEDDTTRGGDDLLGAELAAAAQYCEELLKRLPSEDDQLRTMLGGAIALSADGQRIGVVTPADLQFSPSLQLIGQIRG